MTRHLLAATLMAAFLAPAGCGGGEVRKSEMQGASDAPAARGQVSVQPAEHGNARVSVEVEHLAPPSQLDPSATSYVVWVQQDERGAQPQNMGALAVDENLKGTLETVTPYDSFQLFITPEPSPTMTEPTGQRILETDIESGGMPKQ